MLGLNRVRNRAHKDDSGAVLVTVIVVMLVGAIVASVVAASVMFTIGANVANRSQTQAFVAAESGRDKALAGLSVTHDCDPLDPVYATDGNEPDFTATVYTSAVSDPRPTNSDAMTEGCPTDSTEWVLIESTGRDDAGGSVTINAVYPWEEIIENRSGGVLSYFNNGLKVTASYYIGDIVVRNDDFRCNTSLTITGSLYVLNGNVEFSTACSVTKDVIAKKNVTGDKGFVVGGNVTAGQNVNITSQTGTISSVGGDIHSGGTVTLTGKGGIVTGSIYSYASNGTATPGTSYIPKIDWIVGAAWARGPISDQTGANIHQNSTTVSDPRPALETLLDDLMVRTSWIEISSGTSFTGYTRITGCSPDIPTLLSTGTEKIVIDMTGCTSGAVDIADVQLVHDSVILVREKLVAAVSNISTDGANQRQLFVIQVDETKNAPTAPTCTTNQAKIDVTGAISPNARLMFYTPCGMTGNFGASFTGQLYLAQSDIGFVHAGFACDKMNAGDALDLACSVTDSTGTGEVVVGHSLGSRVWQSE